MEIGKIEKVAIVGAGAVGGYYGARLADSCMDLDVSFLMRGDYEHVRRHGLVVESVAGDFELPEVRCERSSKAIGPVDLVIVAWKATVNGKFEEVITPLLHERTSILTLQNGLGNVEELAGLFGSWRVFGGLCLACINRLGPGHIRHMALGAVRVGEFEPDGTDRLDCLVELLRNVGVDAYAVDNLEKAQWMKLVWNIPFNGLAISEGGVDTRVLLDTPGMEERVRRLMMEVQSVARALGHEIPDVFLDRQIEVTRPMGGYRPSSMIDYVEGRDVEVDAIWCEPVRRARKLGVPVPETEKLLGGIKARLAAR